MEDRGRLQVRLTSEVYNGRNFAIYSEICQALSMIFRKFLAFLAGGLTIKHISFKHWPRPAILQPSLVHVLPDGDSTASVSRRGERGSWRLPEVRQMRAGLPATGARTVVLDTRSGTPHQQNIASVH
jgi:hypothetical protein